MTVPPTGAGAVAGPRLPGAVGVSHLRVYDSVGPDGLAGGTPHLHTACTEAYLVVAGRGAVQTLSAGGFAETPLEPGVSCWFSPGTVHRLVNHGDLELFVVMANSGLPEAGDMVITFGPHVLADPDAYRAAANLPDGATSDDGDTAPARARRDAAVDGFGHWRDRVAADPTALGDLHRLAAALVRPRAAGWADVVAAGPAAAAAEAAAAVADLAAGGTADLAAAAVTSRVPPAPGEGRRLGCCGTLGVVLDR